MSDKEILERAISKAIDGGWNSKPDITDPRLRSDFPQNYKEFIYNHEFAKALWPKVGEAKLYYTYPIRWNLHKDDEVQPTTGLLTEWQYHLQQMVISPDPIKYLGENI